VLAIEAMAAAQALDLLAPLKPSKPAQQALAAIRGVVAFAPKDRVFADDFGALAEVIAAGKLAGILD
jgi:histidine ammonia-lyase